MIKDSEEVLYKCIHQFTIKDCIEIYKVVNNELYTLVRGILLILLYLNIHNVNFNSFLTFKVLIKIILFVCLWNIPTIMFYLSNNKTLQDNISIVSFYESYFKVENKSDIVCSSNIIYYNTMKRKHITKNNIIIESSEPINYTLVNKKSFTIGSSTDVLNLLNKYICEFR